MSKRQSPADVLGAKRVIVSCGAGGVGKTTVSASWALAAARAGRRTLVITVDPSKRLAETLGVAANQPAPVMLDPKRLRALGVEGPGTLSAWMLDPQLVSDHVVRGLAKNEGQLTQLLGNRIYQNVAGMIAGMQEYTAVEALHGFVVDERYDLVVLDTPPSRNALRFLEAPSRATAFLDRKIFHLFSGTGEGGMLHRAANDLIGRILDMGIGKGPREELQQFMRLFDGVFQHLNHNQKEMREFFQSDAVTFALVTSPAQHALEEAYYFEQRTRELQLDMCGYILNRSLARRVDLPLPDPSALTGAARSAATKLMALAEAEGRRAVRHSGLLHHLEERAGAQRFAVALPRLEQGASELESLGELAKILGSGVEPTRPSGRRKRPTTRGASKGLPPSRPWRTGDE